MGVWTRCTSLIKLTWFNFYEGNSSMALKLGRNREFFLVTAWRPRLQTSSRWRHRHFDTCPRFVSWILQLFRASIIMSREFYVPCTPYTYQVSELLLVIFRNRWTFVRICPVISASCIAISSQRAFQIIHFFLKSLDTFFSFSYI